MKTASPLGQGGTSGGFLNAEQTHPGASRPREVSSRLRLRAPLPATGILMRERTLRRFDWTAAKAKEGWSSRTHSGLSPDSNLGFSIGFPPR
jgi:hypothetical protein